MTVSIPTKPVAGTVVISSPITVSQLQYFRFCPSSTICFRSPARHSWIASDEAMATLSVVSSLISLSKLPCSSRVSFKNRAVVVRAGKEVQVDVKEAKGDILPSGEWAESFSLLNYEDLTKHYEPALFKPEAQPHTILAEVMSKLLYIAFPDQALEEVDRYFTEVSGIPVVDDDYRCIGVLSKKDRSKASDSKTKVKDVMSSPAITLSAEKTVSDAAVLMLKNKIHRIPVVTDQMQVVGMVTRTDIFTALEGGA